MQRGYLEQYGEGEDRRNSIIVRAVSLVLITAVISSLLFYLLKNHHQEGVVKSFLSAVRAGDLKAAYRLWGCTDQKPCSGYEYDKFLADWSPQSTIAGAAPDLKLLGLTDSESCNSGVLLTVEVNANRVEKLWVDKREDSINFSPYPICPHRSPWAIMLHRTVGKLRKPLL